MYLVSPLAAEMRVGSQSEMCMRSVDTHPLGKKGLQINPAPRTPPSQSVFFTCRNDQTPINTFVNNSTWDLVALVLLYCYFKLCEPTPRKGQLDAAFRLNPAAGPPLSVVKTMMLFLSKPELCKAFITSPTDVSSLLSIAIEQIKIIIYVIYSLLLRLTKC